MTPRPSASDSTAEIAPMAGALGTSPAVPFIPPRDTPGQVPLADTPPERSDPIPLRQTPLSERKAVAAGYDQKYRNPNYFLYREWLYKPFLEALMKRAKLAPGSRILDVGCGQGFFTSLFVGFGFKALGVDISAEAIRSAENTYGSCGALFQKADVLDLNYSAEFDCIFARGLSLYNSDDFRQVRKTTDCLMKCLKSGGVFIFCYNSNFCPRRTSTAWLFHSLDDVREHFSVYRNTQVYFSTRIEAVLLGHRSFSSWMTRLAALNSRLTGIGGELVAFVSRVA